MTIQNTGSVILFNWNSSNTACQQQLQSDADLVSEGLWPDKTVRCNVTRLSVQADFDAYVFGRDDRGYVDAAPFGLAAVVNASATAPSIPAVSGSASVSLSLIAEPAARASNVTAVVTDAAPVAGE